MELIDELNIKRSPRGEALGAVLKILATGSFIAAAMVVPNAAVALAPLISKHSGVKLPQAQRALRYAMEKGWVVMRETHDGTEIALTDRGKLKWQKLYLDQPLRSKRWDGRWRIVIFDVPDKKKLARDAFRSSLRRLGFVQLQESVWITPHACGKEILALRELYKIAPYVKLIEAADLEGNKQLASKFGL